LTVFWASDDIKAGIKQPFRRKKKAYLKYLGNGDIKPDLAAA